MYTLEELNETQSVLTNIVYKAHQARVDCPAQQGYQYLSWIKDIALGRARQEIDKVETIENGFFHLKDIIATYADHHPDFMEKDFALTQLDKFINETASVFYGRRQPLEASAQRETVPDYEAQTDYYQQTLSEIETLALRDGNADILEILEKARTKYNYR